MYAKYTFHANSSIDDIENDLGLLLLNLTSSMCTSQSCDKTNTEISPNLPSNSRWVCSDGSNMTMLENSLPSSALWSCVASNEYLICAIAYNSNKVAISTDGTTWSAVTLPITGNWHSIAWNGSIFCAIELNGTKVVKSSNGSTWTNSTLPSSSPWNTIIAKNGVFYTGSAKSSDGITWVPITVSNVPLSSLAVSSNLLYRISNSIVSSNLYTSKDSLTWYTKELPITAKWKNIAYGNDTLIIISDYTSLTPIVLISSDNGDNWKQSSFPVTSNVVSLLWSGENFYALAKNGNIYISPDGEGWGTLNTTRRIAWSSLNFFKKHLVVLAYSNDITFPSIASTSDTTFYTNLSPLINNATKFWQLSSNPTDSGWSDLISYKDGICLQKTNSIAIFDDTAWSTEILNFAGFPWKNVVYNNISIAMIGSDNSLAVKKNNIWQRITTFSSFLLASNGKIFCLLEKSSGFVYHSTDAVNWLKVPGVTISNAISINSSGGLFCVLTSNLNSSIVYTSDNGENWINTNTFAYSLANAIIVSSGLRFYIYSTGSPLLSSYDGKSWVTLPALGNLIPNPITSLSALYTIDSANNTVLSTIDGTEWLSNPFIGIINGIATSNKFVYTFTSANLLYKAKEHPKNYFPIRESYPSLSYIPSDPIPSSSLETINKLTYGNGIFCAISNNENNYRLKVSIGGISWVDLNPFLTNVAYKDITYNSRIFCTIAANGSNSVISVDGYNWVTHNIPLPTGNWIKIISNEDIFCALSSNGQTATSIDGINWVAGGTTVTTNWLELIWTGSKFCAISDDGYFTTSSDGKIWFSENIETTGVRGLVWNGNIFCTISNTDNVSLTSSDGLGWTSHPLGTSFTTKNLIWMGQYFLATSLGTAVLTSPDGITWTSHTLPSAMLKNIAYDGKNLLTLGDILDFPKLFDLRSYNQEDSLSLQPIYKSVRFFNDSSNVGIAVNDLNGNFSSEGFNSQLLDLTYGGVILANISPNHIAFSSYSNSTKKFNTNFCGIFEYSDSNSSATYAKFVSIGDGGIAYAPKRPSGTSKIPMNISNRIIEGNLVDDVYLENPADRSYGLYPGKILGGIKQTTSSFLNGYEVTINGMVYQSFALSNNTFLIPKK